MTLRASIIEDDLEGRDYLLHVLQCHYPQVAIVGTATTVSAGVALLKKQTTDLLFLDVELSDGDGFDVLKHTAPAQFTTVFTTGFEHYAIEAIRHAAFDYLLKPILLDDLQNTMARITQKDRLSAPLPNPVATLHPLNRERMLLSDGRTSRVVDLSEILHIAADDHYLYVFLQDGSRMVITDTLQEMEQRLPDRFFRVHRSHNVQLSAIAEVTFGRGGQLKLQNGQLVPIAYRKKSALKKRLQGLL